MPTKEKHGGYNGCCDIINLGNDYNGPHAVQKVKGFTIKAGFVPFNVGVPEACLGVYGVRGVNLNSDIKIKDCIFEDLSTGVVSYGGRTDIESNVFANNSSGISIWYNTSPVSISYNVVRDNKYGGIINYNGNAVISNNTVIRTGHNSILTMGGGIWDNANATIKNNIVAFNYYGITVSPATNEAGCNNVFENQINFRRQGTPIDPPNATDISIDPQFCDPVNNNFKLSDASPCAAENSNSCGQIGALEMGCLTTPVKSTSWGKLKSIYR